jgi:hypothetical protein
MLRSYFCKEIMKELKLLLRDIIQLKMQGKEVLFYVEKQFLQNIGVLPEHFPFE